MLLWNTLHSWEHYGRLNVPQQHHTHSGMIQKKVKKKKGPKLYSRPHPPRLKSKLAFVGCYGTGHHPNHNQNSLKIHCQWPGGRYQMTHSGCYCPHPDRSRLFLVAEEKPRQQETGGFNVVTDCTAAKTKKTLEMFSELVAWRWQNTIWCCGIRPQSLPETDSTFVKNRWLYNNVYKWKWKTLVKHVLWHMFNYAA